WIFPHVVETLPVLDCHRESVFVPHRIAFPSASSRTMVDGADFGSRGRRIPDARRPSILASTARAARASSILIASGRTGALAGSVRGASSLAVGSFSHPRSFSQVDR